MTIAWRRIGSLLPLAVGGALAVSLVGPGLSAGTSAFAAILTVEHVLPLLGLGLLLGQLPSRDSLRGGLLLLVGGLAGIMLREPLYGLLGKIPGAAPHLFLSGPIALALTGLAVVLPQRIRPPFAILLLPVIGAAMALATWLGDPTLFAPYYLPSAVALQSAVVLAIALPARQFQTMPVLIATRIGASWMIAVALLFGGAYLAGKDRSLTPPTLANLPLDGVFPGFERVPRPEDTR